MIILIAVLVIVTVALLWLTKCLYVFVHAEEIIKYEQWEEEKMVNPF